MTITGIAPYAFTNRSSDNYVYSNTTLISVSIPKTVTEIGDHAFDNCSAMTTLRWISCGGPTVIGEYAFYRCTKLQNLAIPNGVTTIGKCAFYRCTGLTSVTIPDSVTSIGKKAFYLYNSSGSFQSLTMPGELDPTGWLLYYGMLDTLTFTGKRVLGQPHTVVDVPEREGFDHSGNNLVGRNVNKVVISDSVEVIEPHAFCGCNYLTEVTGCANVTTIGAFAFMNCDKLSHIELGQKLTTIERQAFLECDGLTAVTLPEGIKRLDYACFAWCRNLVNLNLPDSLETIGKYCFSGDMKIQIIDMSQAPDALIEKRTLISGTASLPSVLVRATGGQASQGWGIRSENNDGEDPTQYARWYEESGKLYLEAVSSGRVILETFDNYTGARGSKLLEIRGGTVIRPAEPGYLVSGEKLALSAWKMPAETQVSVQWSLAQGDEQYASISTSGLLTARAVSEAHTITVTATPTDGSEPATRTLRILPKTTGMSLALEGSILGRELSVDMSMRTSLTLTARQEPEDALQGIAWSSSSGAVASVDEGGTVTLHKPGTAVITAASTDGSGVKATLTLNVFYVDGAKTLTVSADVPEIGLQPGQSALLTVSGSAVIPAEKLDFTLSQKGIVTVDETGLVTAGNTPGTVTVTAALRGDPLGRKASLKITVIPLQVQELELIPSVGDSRAQVIEDENSQRLHHRQHPRRQGQLPADAHPPSGGDGPDRHPAHRPDPESAGLPVRKAGAVPVRQGQAGYPEPRQRHYLYPDQAHQLLRHPPERVPGGTRRG